VDSIGVLFLMKDVSFVQIYVSIFTTLCKSDDVQLC